MKVSKKQNVTSWVAVGAENFLGDWMVFHFLREVRTYGLS